MKVSQCIFFKGEAPYSGEIVEMSNTVTKLDKPKQISQCNSVFKEDDFLKHNVTFERLLLFKDDSYVGSLCFIYVH